MSIARSFDPRVDHWAYVAELSNKKSVSQSVLDEMYNLKHDAMERIDTIIHPEYAAEFRQLLAYGLNQGSPEAKTIARKLGLGQQHFAALDDDSQELSRLIDKEMFDSIGQRQYEDREYDRYEDYV